MAHEMGLAFDIFGLVHGPYLKSLNKPIQGYMDIYIYMGLHLVESVEKPIWCIYIYINGGLTLNCVGKPIIQSLKPMSIIG